MKPPNIEHTTLKFVMARTGILFSGQVAGSAQNRRMRYRFVGSPIGERNVEGFRGHRRHRNRDIKCCGLRVRDFVLAEKRRWEEQESRVLGKG
jgi:hypothetical protein